jgi:hypothetical protein
MEQIVRLVKDYFLRGWSSSPSPALSGTLSREEGRERAHQ